MGLKANDYMALLGIIST